MNHKTLINRFAWPGLPFWAPLNIKPLDCWQSVFLSKFSRDYEERLFRLKENGTRHGRSTHEIMFFCVRDD